MKTILLMILALAALSGTPRSSFAATTVVYGSVCQIFDLGHGLCQVVCNKGSCSGTSCSVTPGAGGTCTGPIVKAYDPHLVVDPEAGLEQLYGQELVNTEAAALAEGPAGQSEALKPAPKKEKPRSGGVDQNGNHDVGVLVR